MAISQALFIFALSLLLQERSESKVRLKDSKTEPLAAVFSSDQQYLVGYMNDAQIPVWNAKNGLLISNIKTPGLSFHDADTAISLDNTRIVGSSSLLSVAIWDLVKAEKLHTLKRPPNGPIVLACAFNPDNSIVAIGNADDSASLWNIKSDGVKTLLGHSSSVLSVCFSKDGKMLVTGSRDETARLWDVKTGLEVKKLEGFGGCIRSVRFAGNDSLLLAFLQIGFDRPTPAVIVKRIKDGKNIVSFPGWRRPEATSDGKYLAAISDNSDKIAIWDLVTKAEVFRYTASGMRRVLGISFDSEANLHCAIEDNEGLYVLALKTGIKVPNSGK
jgi:WD40 repeat protein